MFSIHKSRPLVVTKDFEVKFNTSKGDVELLKGERVKALVVEDVDGKVYHCIQKKSGALIFFKSNESFEKFLERF